MITMRIQQKMSFFRNVARSTIVGQSFSIYIYKQSAKPYEIWCWRCGLLVVVVKLLQKFYFPLISYRMFPFSFFYLHIHFELFFFCSFILLCSLLIREHNRRTQKNSTCCTQSPVSTLPWCIFILSH